MTIAEIKDDADMAETWPGSGVLNWGEIGFKTLAAWVALNPQQTVAVGFKTLAAWVAGNPQQTVAATDTFDVESVKGMFEEWWRTANDDLSGA